MVYFYCERRVSVLLSSNAPISDPEVMKSFLCSSGNEQFVYLLAPIVLLNI